MKSTALSLLAAGTALVAFSAPAMAAPPVSTVPTSDGNCSVSDIAPTASACVGYFDKNILNANSDNLTAIGGALSTLFGTATTLTNVQFSALPNVTNLSGTDPNFASPPAGSSNIVSGFKLYGITVVGIHWGNGQGGGNVTGFYRFDAGTSGMGVVDIVRAQGATSNLVVFKTGTPPPPPPVPEPASWAMMIGGMGLVGAALRRRATRAVFA